MVFCATPNTDTWRTRKELLPNDTSLVLVKTLCGSFSATTEGRAKPRKQRPKTTTM